MVDKASEKVAENIVDKTSAKNSGQNYIEELKGLKELLDQGIISKSEFNERKKKILKK